MLKNVHDVEAPTHWYNVVADLPFELPKDIVQPRTPETQNIKLQLPLELVRQSISRDQYIEIPEEVRQLYKSWRPTPLVRAKNLENWLKTPAKIYYKYEGNNISGSHKLCTGIAQAYYYKKAGAVRLTTGTGAGQWGTALAVGCRSFDLDCKVYMVGASYNQKPYRRTIMQMQGADVVPSPSGAKQNSGLFLDQKKVDTGNMAFAVTEALADALSNEGSMLSVGSGEAYSILHSTAIGIEAKEQLSKLGETPDIVIASLGAGSNFGGIALPILKDNLEGSKDVRCRSVEPSACPKLTRGVYRYDRTDGSGITPLQKMYTLGNNFRTPNMHAGGLRYHACSKIISALYHHNLIEAVAYPQTTVFKSAIIFHQLEGVVPAPESAHAIHGAIQEALKAKEEGKSPNILFCLSGHGLYDLSAYEQFLSGKMNDYSPTDADIADSLEKLPLVEE
ncbi:MAG: TrpB-like pyridoxal phosphate-dependent enzyme [Exilibacterium sp.]